MKIGFVFNEKKFAGKLTKFFTGCYAYHVFWVDEENGKMYDMNFLRRRRKWPHYDLNNVVLFDVPEVTREYLEDQLDQSDDVYGVFDYLLFMVRPIYHLFGASTRNQKGVICSEMVNRDIWACGGSTIWFPDDPPPSPCDLYYYFKDKTWCP